MSDAAASAVALGESGEIHTEQRQKSRFGFVRSVNIRCTQSEEYDGGVDGDMGQWGWWCTKKKNMMCNVTPTNLKNPCFQLYTSSSGPDSLHNSLYQSHMCHSLTNLWFPWRHVRSSQSQRRQTYWHNKSLSLQTDWNGLLGTHLHVHKHRPGFSWYFNSSCTGQPKVPVPGTCTTSERTLRPRVRRVVINHHLLSYKTSNCE